MQHTRGKLDYDETVAHYWPEFAQQGKEKVTVRALLDHAVGLGGPSPPITLAMLVDKVRWYIFGCLHAFLVG